MKKLKRFMSVGAAAGVLILGSGLLTANLAMAESSSDSPGITVEEKPIYVSPQTPGSDDSGRSAAAKAALICTALQKVDSPHISKTSATRAAQAHGAWNKGNCKSDKAVVTTQLDRQGGFGLFFAVGNAGKGVLNSTNGMPSGSANRVTAHYGCKGTTQGTFRAWTDVDVVGIADLPNKITSNETKLACG